MAMMVALAATGPARGIELFKRFSLLSERVPDHCSVPADQQGEIADAGQPGSCVLLSVPPLDDYTTLKPWLWDNPLGTAAESARASLTQPGSYALSQSWTADLAYHRELLYPTAAGKDVRNRQFSLFAADQDRDVLDMHLLWRLSWSELNFGYQVQSNRTPLTAAAAQNYSVRRLVSNADLDHALTIGITRRFNTGH